MQYILSRQKTRIRNTLKFDTLITTAIRIKEEKGDAIPEINALYANIVSKPSYNLRAVKLAGKVIIFVDGKEMMNIDGDWPPSQVGLVSTNMRCSYNGITFFGLY